MEFKELVTRRYSCKKYGDSLVADDTIASILEVARHAPTAKNLQEQHVYVIKSEEGLAKVDELTPCRYGAPVVLMVQQQERLHLPGRQAQLRHRGRQHRGHAPRACGCRCRR